MPLYEYRCKQCNRVFEVIQKFADAPLTVHADCGGEVERLISAPGLQFKGSGWYVTDYARSGGKSNGGKETKETKETKESTTTESKPTETKSESSTPAKT